MGNSYDKLYLLNEDDSAWRKDYWKQKNKTSDEEFKELAKHAKSSKTVLKPRNKEDEVIDFYQAQLDITKDVLPKHTMADNNRTRVDLFDQQWHRDEDFAEKDKMKMTPQEAFTEVYPSGKNAPQSMALKPTSSIGDDHKCGYRGDEAGVVGPILLETKSEQCKWIGDHYLPKQTQDNKDSFTPPVFQLSSGGDGKEKCNLNVGSLIEEALNKKNMKFEIDMSANISAAKEKQFLNRPFKSGSPKAYAVLVKNDKNEISKIDFDACKECQASSPKWTAEYWAARVNEAEAKEVSLNQLADFFAEKVLDPKKDDDWDGKTFYRKAELEAKFPTLVNSKPSYDDKNVVNKEAKTFSDLPTNPERK